MMKNKMISPQHRNKARMYSVSSPVKQYNERLPTIMKERKIIKNKVKLPLFLHSDYPHKKIPRHLQQKQKNSNNNNSWENYVSLKSL